MNPRAFHHDHRSPRPRWTPERLGPAALCSVAALLGACDEGSGQAPVCGDAGADAKGGAVCLVDAATDAHGPDTKGALDAANDAEGIGDVDAFVDHGEVKLDASADTEASSCDPLGDPQGSPCALNEAYGVFVASSGADNGPGTEEGPLRTISEGLAQAQRTGKSRVFVCQGRYGESLAIGGTRGDTSLYGGLGCIGGWRWTGALVEVVAPTSLSALRIDPTTSPVTVADVSLTANDARGQDGSGAGNSAVAAWVHGARVTFRRVTFFAGKGADGAPGMDGSANGVPNYPVGQPAAPPGAAFSYAPFLLGAGGKATCFYNSSSQGGTGGAPGDPSTPLGYPGSVGTSVPSAGLADLSGFYNGAGGAPLPPSCPPGAGAGNPGANGYSNGGGAMATSYGSLVTTEWLPSSGGDGDVGNPGQGGGGGAGAPYATSSAIFGGAGGGAGGCGGAGGGGGHGAGGSFALVSFQSDATLFASTLIASDGGKGGAGGVGQPGQSGGLGGVGGPCSGPGGGGGNGAGGGGGGGGTGGLSVGIAYQGTVPTYDSNTTIVFGNPGTEGLGGSGGAHAVTAGQVGLDGPGGSYGRGGVATAVLSL